MRRLWGTKRVGHAGTLDPMATGVLILATERATKLLRYVTAHDKTYAATVRLGQATVTDDAEGDVTSEADASGVTEDAVRAAVAGFVGEIDQVPSSVSAIKVDGKRAYARVRAGDDVELAARRVSVYNARVLAIRREGALLDVDIEVAVSAGTYVRAIARDLGAALGVGGHLTALRRTSVGSIGLGAAVTLEELERRIAAGDDLPGWDLSAAALAVLPAVPVSAEDARNLGSGRAVSAPDGASLALAASPEGHGAAVVPSGEVVAVVEIRGGALLPVVVFAPVVGAAARATRQDGDS